MPKHINNSPYKLLRLKRHRPNKHGRPGDIFVSVQQRQGRRWIKLGTFDSEGDAIDFLVDRAEIMELVEQMREEAELEDLYEYQYED